MIEQADQKNTHVESLLTLTNWRILINTHNCTNDNEKKADTWKHTNSLVTEI